MVDSISLLAKVLGLARYPVYPAKLLIKLVELAKYPVSPATLQTKVLGLAKSQGSRLFWQISVQF